MKGHQDELHKKLPAIWDAIDQHKWGVALRLLNPLQSKFPESSVVNACSALCHHCSDSKDVSRKIMSKLLETPQTDPRAIQPMRVVLSQDEDWKNLSRMFKMTFEATQRVEDGEEYFLALARERRFNDMQAAALHLHRLSKSVRHKRWQIAAMYLQCPIQSLTKTPAADPSSNLHVKLCTGSLERSLLEDNHGESFQLLVELKQQCGKAEEAAELLLSELALKCNTMYSEEMRFIQAARILLEGNSPEKAYALLVYLAKELKYDNYAIYRMIVDATSRICSREDFDLSLECSVSIPSKGVTPTAACSVEASLQLMIGLATRGSVLGSLEMLTAVLEGRLGAPAGLIPLQQARKTHPKTPATDSDLIESFFVVLVDYTKTYFGKPCCFPDTLNYIPRVAAYLKLDPASFIVKFRAAVGADSHEEADVFFFRVEYALGGFDSFNEEEAIKFSGDCLAKFEKRYSSDPADAKTKSDESERAEDHYIIIGALVMLQNAQKRQAQAGARSSRVKFTLLSAALLDAALAVRGRNYELHCLKCRVHALLGCPDFSFASQMDLKNVQHDTLSYLLIHCMSRCGQWANVRRMCNAITHFHRSYHRDYPNQFTQIFEHGTLSKLKEIMRFENRVKKSITRLEADFECMLQITLVDPVGGNADFKEFLSTVEPALPVFFDLVASGSEAISNEDFNVVDILVKRPMGDDALALRNFILPIECNSTVTLDSRVAFCRSMLASILCIRAINLCDAKHSALVKEKQQKKGKAEEAQPEKPVDSKDPVFTSPLAAATFFSSTVEGVLLAYDPHNARTWTINALPMRALEKALNFAAHFAQIYSEKASDDLTETEVNSLLPLLGEATASAETLKAFLAPLLGYIQEGATDESKVVELLQNTPVFALDFASLLAPLSRALGLIVEIFNLLIKWRALRGAATLKSSVLKYFKSLSDVLQVATDFLAAVGADKRKSWAAARGLMGVEEELRGHSSLEGERKKVANRVASVAQHLATHSSVQIGEMRRLLDEQKSEFTKKFPKLLEK